MSLDTGRTAVPSSGAGPSHTTPRLLDPRHLPVVVGIVALVTLAAFENRAVMTILPTVVTQLDGWGLFGAATGATLVTYTVAIALSGGWTDRRGPRRVLLTGLALFAGAQVVCGLAPSMALFTAGRGLSGAAEALIDTSLMVLVAQTLPAMLRAKVFAFFAAAWILPSLLGPSVAAALDAVGGWRLVFLGPLLVVPLALLLLRPALRRSCPRASGEPVGAGDGGHPSDDPPVGAARRRFTAPLVLAGGLALTAFAAPLLASPSGRTGGVCLIVLGLLAVLAGAVRALPAGTARLAPGIPAVVGMRLLVAAAFSGVGGAVPLMLVVTQHVSTAVAGVSLSVTGVFWAAGSALNGVDAVQRRLGGAARVRLGGTLIAVGALGPMLLALDVVGLVPGMAGWAFAGIGMGVLSPTLSTEVLRLAPDGEQGRASAAAGLAMSTGVALQTGVVGAVVAWAGPAIGGGVFAALMLSGALTAGIVALTAGRVTPRREGSPTRRRPPAPSRVER